MRKKFVVGTRDSQLALWQSEWVLKRLKAHNPDIHFDLLPVKTQGDKILDVALSKIGDKGLFTKELEIALLDKTIDIAVHSLKDLPTKLPEGLTLGCVTARENPQDVLISPKGYTLSELPEGAVVGTSSLRRISQLLSYRGDLVIKDLRGNLNTRLRKMDEQGFDAIVLAAAGVLRLGWEHRISEYIAVETLLPAVGQGALGVEIREGDHETQEILSILHDKNTYYATLAERSFLSTLEGGCQIPIGALAQCTNDSLTLEGMVASLDGKTVIKEQCQGVTAEAKSLGIALAEAMLQRGAGEILSQVRQENDSI